MSVRSVLRRLENANATVEQEPGVPCTVPRRPDPDAIAFCVACSRALKQLSIQALASMAGVSTSSIERIERGERVSDKTLRKVAVAVNQKEDAFTAERIPLSRDETERALIAWAAPYEGMTVVPVSHFTKQRQVRELSRCDGALIDGSRLDDDAQSLVADLREWIDLAGYIRATQEHDAFITSEPFPGICEFNREVLAAVREVERVGRATALTGCYDAEWVLPDPVNKASRTIPVRVGLMALFPKETDPCAIKRRILWAPEQIVYCLPREDTPAH